MFYDKLNIANLDFHIEQMKNTEQDPIWHGEGCVWIHTLMVINEVEKLDLPENDKDILRFASLLHDIGKPYCSTIEDGHLRSHGHSRLGYHVAKELLEGNKDKLQILNLIMEHGNPQWVLTKENPEREVIKLSMSCRLDLLYYIAKCDVLGRISEPNTFLEDLEYFKELAIELDCFTKPYEFKSNIAKFNCLVKKTHHHSDSPFDDTRSKVTMVCGLPGSGKDYYIKNNLSHLPVISLDEIRIELGIKPTDEQGSVIQSAKEKAREYMRKSEDFVWNATNITKSMRTNLISFFTEYNSYVNIIFIDKPLSVILAQNKDRNISVPADVIVKLNKKMEFPTYSESHELSFQ